MPPALSPLVTVVVAGGVAAAAYVGSAAVLAAVLGVQVLLAIGLLLLDGGRDRLRSAALATFAGAVAAVGLYLGWGRGDEPALGVVAYTVGPAVVLALLLQMTRRDGRPDLVESLAATITAIALAGMTATLVVLAAEPDGGALCALIATCAGLAALPSVAPGQLPGPIWLWKVLALGAAASAAVVGLGDAAPQLALDSTVQYGVGGGAVVVGAVGGAAARRLGSTVAARALLIPACAIAAAAPVAYVLERVLVA